MEDNRPRIQGKVTVVLATPIVRAPENEAFAQYLRAVVTLGLVDLRIPQPDWSEGYVHCPPSPFSTQRYTSQSNFYPASFFGCRYTPHRDIEGYFHSVDRELTSQERHGVVIFGSAIDAQPLRPEPAPFTVSVDAFHVSTNISAPESIRGSRSGLLRARIDLVPTLSDLEGQGSIPIFPEVPTSLTSLGVRIAIAQSELHYWEGIVATDKVARRYVELLPDKQLPRNARVLGKADHGKVNPKHFPMRELFRMGDQILLPGNWDDDPKKRLFIARIDPQDLMRQVMNVVEQSVSCSGDVIDERSAAEVIRAESSEQLIKLIRDASARFGHVKLPSTKELFLSRDEVDSRVRERTLMSGVELDIKLLDHLRQSRAETTREMNKTGFALLKSFVRNRGSDPLNSIVWDVTARIEKANQIIDGIKSRHNIDSPDLPFEDALRLASAFRVHRTGTDLLVHIRAVERGENAFQATLKTLEKSLPKRGSYAPIPDEVIYRLMRNIAAQLIDGVDEHERPILNPERARLIDAVEEKHGHGIRSLFDITEGVKAVDDALDEIDFVDGELSASQRAAQLPSILASTGITRDVIIRREIQERAATSELGDR